MLLTGTAATLFALSQFINLYASSGPPGVSSLHAQMPDDRRRPGPFHGPKNLAQAHQIESSALNNEGISVPTNRRFMHRGATFFLTDETAKSSVPNAPHASQETRTTENAWDENEWDSRVIGGFTDRPLAPPLAFDDFKIEATDDAELTAALTAASRAAWPRINEDGQVGRFKRTLPEDGPVAEEHNLSLRELSSGGHFLVPEASSYVAWIVICLLAGAAIYRDKLKMKCYR